MSTHTELFGLTDKAIFQWSSPFPQGEMASMGDVPLGRYICIVLDLALDLLKLVNMQTEIFIAVMFLLQKKQKQKKTNKRKHQIFQAFFENTLRNHGSFQKQPSNTIAFFKNTPSNHIMIQKSPLATIKLFKHSS